MSTHFSYLGNDELTAELSRLARCEREASAALIVHLAEFGSGQAIYERVSVPGTGPGTSTHSDRSPIP